MMLLDYWFGPKSVDRMKHRTTGVWWSICMTIYQEKKMWNSFIVLKWQSGRRYCVGLHISLYPCVKLSYCSSRSIWVLVRSCVEATSSDTVCCKLTLKWHLSAWAVQISSTAFGNLELKSLFNQYVRNEKRMICDWDIAVQKTDQYGWLPSHSI